MRNISGTSGLRGAVRVPGDKSISHRSVMLGAIAEGITHVSGFLNGADCISTVNCFRKMGVNIEYDGGTGVVVHGAGLNGLKAPGGILDCGNSGTTTRIMSGLLAGQPFISELTGDSSIQKRPMKRIMTPLREMGADIISVNDNDCAPLRIRPSRLHGISYASPVASAQVKSSILMAALYAEGGTTVTEPALSRDHTELMLAAMGADIRREGLSVSINPGRTLYARDMEVPGDISSAAYFIGAGLMVPDSDIMIGNVGINPTRAGILKVFKDMGADIGLVNERTVNGERVSDLHVRTSALHGTEISGDIIPTLIDELPLIAVVAANAEGTTIIKDASELKVKESDRIALVTKNLKAMGADIEAEEDGFIINGSRRTSALKGAVTDDAFDHRLAMAFSVAGLIAAGDTVIPHPECVAVSYPGFFEDIERLRS